MSKREYPLPKWPGDPWDLMTLRKYERSVLGGSRFFYPPLFLKAVERYTDRKFVLRSEIWAGLQKWRDYAKRTPEATLSCRVTPPSTDDREFVVYFKELILAAVFYGQKEILETLLETAPLTNPPETDVHGVRATIAAFANLFRVGSCPTKKEVRKAAIEILRQAGSPIPGKREWPRIFQKAGLSGLCKPSRLKPGHLFDGLVYYSSPPE